MKKVECGEKRRSAASVWAGVLLLCVIGIGTLVVLSGCSITVSPESESGDTSVDTGSGSESSERDIDAEVAAVMAEIESMDRTLDWDKTTPRYDSAALKQCLDFYLQPAYKVIDTPSDNGEVRGKYEKSDVVTNWDVLSYYSDGEAVLSDPETWELAGFTIGPPMKDEFNPDPTKQWVIVDQYFRHAGQEGEDARVEMEAGTFAIGGVLALSGCTELDSISVGDGALLDELIMEDCPAMEYLSMYAMNDAAKPRIVVSGARAFSSLKLPEEVQQGRDIYIDLTGSQYDSDILAGSFWVNMEVVSPDSPSYQDILDRNDYQE